MRHVIMHPCIMVLAAGRSSRLGRPKQLLMFRGKSLIRHTVDIALESGTGPVCVITGACSEMMEASLQGSGAQLVFNEQWEEGMASSIRKAVSAIASMKPMPDGILFMVCDQPFADVPLLRGLISRQAATGAAITACSYDGTKGTPALYHRSVFSELAALEGDKGAKNIIQRHLHHTELLPFPQGGLDIDTESDYLGLINKAEEGIE